MDKNYYGSNLHHYNGKIFSYSTCIGQVFEANGKKVYIVNTGNYSVTTAKHQRYVSGAIPCDALVFTTSVGSYGGSSLVDANSVISKIIFGFKYLIRSYNNFQNASTLRTETNELNQKLFAQANKWFEVTGCMTMKKLLRTSLKELRNFHTWENIPETEMKKFKKFIKMMVENKPISEIVDMVNGEGTWEKYQQRISGILLRKRNQKLSEYIGYKNPKTRYSSASIFGKYAPSVEGSITNSVRKKHEKSGDWIKFLYEERKKNIAEAINSYERRRATMRRNSAISRLELYCGVKGFYWRRNLFTSFNYNGTIIDFSKDDDSMYLRERGIEYNEYMEFISLSKSEQAEWIRRKKDWMLQDLQEQKRELEENRRLRREREERELNARKAQLEYYENNKGRIANLQLLGDEGKETIWHECLQSPTSSIYVYNADFHGGNVWLRVNPFKQLVETSKGISIGFDECKRLWAIINRWHKNNTEFVAGESVQATNHTWEIERYQRDIMIAGCHAIAYSEMKNVAIKLGFEI